MEKQVISVKEFDKKVETEASYLEYMNNMGKEKAYKKATEYVNSRYEKQ